MEITLLIIIGVLGAALVGTLLFVMLRKPNGSLGSSADMAVVSEKLSHIEPVVQIANGLHTELRTLSERVSQVEQNQNAVQQNVQSLGTGLAATKTVTDGLAKTAETIRTELSRTSEGLTDLRSRTTERHEMEARTAESVRRLEAVIAGTQTRGSAGENILEELFSKLPIEWQMRDFKVGNKFVEFGLRLPNNLVLPIDSKWTATSLLDQLSATDDTAEMLKLKSQIESLVMSRAKEVQKYLDPSLTINFGVAAVPDAVYDICSGVQVQMFRQNVVLVSYSMFLPYLLLVFQTVLKTSQNIDLEMLDSYMKTAQDSMELIQEELEGRFSRAITMLNNSRSDMSTQIGKVRSGLTAIQAGTGNPERPAVSDVTTAFSDALESPAADS